MPYCRKCGAKLEENARFCHVCGTPVAVAPPSPPAPRRRPTYILPVAVVVGVLLIVLVISALIFLPIMPYSFAQTDRVAAQTGVHHLNLNIQADIADVNIIPKSMNANILVLNVSATGATGILGSASPINVTVRNQTINNMVTVTSEISHAVAAPFAFNTHVVCDVYVDPKVTLNLTVHSSVGQIVMNAQNQTIQALNLQATTGAVEATLARNVVVAGNVSVSTTTGTANFDWDQADADGNVSVNVKSVTGSVNVNVARNSLLSGNVTVDAGTTTGSVNLTMDIRDYVGARIESHTNFGGINVKVEHFSGDQSPIQSNNYPAGSNFLISLRTTTGGINIDATYETSATQS